MSRFERLTAEHPVQSFSSGSNDLDSWLHDAAVTADRAGTARVWLWLNDANGIDGYFAIAPHNIRRDEVPPGIGRGSPDIIPGYLLARLAVAEPLQGSGRGGELLVAAMVRMLEAIRVGGGRVLAVDAIDDRARRFYERHGFQPIPENAHRLLMKASTAAKSLGLEWP